VSTVHRVVLYSRRGCHLCDVARLAIEQVRARHAFDLEEIDIDAADHLIRDYGLRVPVVAVDGEDVFEIDVDPRRLTALVRS
jgi:glutaredoxin